MKGIELIDSGRSEIGDFPDLYNFVTLQKKQSRMVPNGPSGIQIVKRNLDESESVLAK